MDHYNTVAVRSEIPHLYNKQILAHTRMILRYGFDQQDTTGFLLHMAVEAMRLELGLNGKLLASPLLLGNHITKLWLKHVWVSTQESGITLLTNFADYPHQW